MHKRHEGSMLRRVESGVDTEMDTAAPAWDTKTALIKALAMILTDAEKADAIRRILKDG